MKKKFIRFLIRITIYSVLLGLVVFILSLALPENTLPRVLPYLFILFYLATTAVHFILLRITELRPGRFVSYFMLTTFLKLVIYFIAILLYVFLTKEGILAFILSFFILYILYTVFEVVTFLAQTSKPDQQ